MRDVHIIAEAGANHGGDLQTARTLVDIARGAGADSVKFQDIDPEGLYITRFVEHPSGQAHDSAVLARRRAERLAREDVVRLYEYGRETGIPVTFSVFDPDDARFHAAQAPLYLKVASTDINYTALLDALAATTVPAIVSTGMSSADDVERAVDIFTRAGALARLTLLHCVSVYPCPYAGAELGRITALAQRFPVPVGFSDHTQDPAAATIAVALGAAVIEKHFTYDKHQPGFDHRYAADPAELQHYIERIRATERALAYAAERQEAERITRVRARRGLYAARDLEPGHVVTADDLLARRPSNTLGPEDASRVVGMRVTDRVLRHQGLEVRDGAVFPDTANLWRAAAAHWEKEMREKGM